VPGLRTTGRPAPHFLCAGAGMLDRILAYPQALGQGSNAMLSGTLLSRVTQIPLRNDEEEEDTNANDAQGFDPR
jgi:hypothetical protein